MNKKISVIVTTFILILQLPTIPMVSGDFLPVRAYANDTVAGFPTMLRSSLINPGQRVVFVVEKPDSSVVQVFAEANIEGVAKADLFGHQTKIAGDYKVALVYPGGANSSPQESFAVYADSVSSAQSVIRVMDPLLIAGESEATFVTVTLYDAYRNPIKNHQIQLISSRGEDKVEAINSGITDEMGRANFKINSLYPGISSFTAIDTTMNVILKDRKEIVFQESTPKEKAFGGNLFRTDLIGGVSAQEEGSLLPGPVHHFEIQDVPLTVRVGTDINVTVVAKDANNNTAKNYTGTILFSVPDDENAELPSNGQYSFKEVNRGKFTFNLALRFTQIGKQTIQILDKDNWDINGELEVNVVAVESISPAVLSDHLEIKSPADGSELGSSSLILTGRGESNVSLKVFDNDVKIGNTETDFDGFFSFDVKALESGHHSFYVMSNKGDVSESVGIAIDTLAPVLNQFTVLPEGNVKAGEALTVTADSEPGLEEVKLRLQGIEEMMIPVSTQPGSYKAILAAPVSEGEFGIDLILVDRLGNRAQLNNQHKIRVIPVKKITPSQVQGLQGQAQDAQVSLSWKGIGDYDGIIHNYRVYYGRHFDALNEVKNTPSTETALTVGNLENDTQYFFAVRAVDSKGLESTEASTIVALTPKSLAPAPVVPATAFPATGYRAIMNQGSAQIHWPVFPGAFYYKVIFGVQSGQYDDFLMTENNVTQLIIPDLIDGMPYHFRVVALNLARQEISALSPEFTFETLSTGFYGSAPALPNTRVMPYTQPIQFQNIPITQATGAEALWIIFASLFMAQFFYFQKKRFFP